ncbi:polysaccharide biosynthesis protein [Paenibacillus nanensis]|uniref:Polysaccharide biosynthesis protein n=1 Tax=Paenibacillus nanensis TaxID=393251 RepID=A0A3A1UYV4_9BACL|nr:polysaccharide biosynthesis protein [Paenibacillus nanensis]RIX52342.1 polysaccharide biosynthesis protein [Paenibacillus nanensis]
MKKDIHGLDVSRLLGRKPVIISKLYGASDYIRGQVVLITGAGGSIGSELALQVALHQPGKLLLLGHGENSIFSVDLILKDRFPDVPVESLIVDIQDELQLRDVFQRYKPQIVFHAAAHKHVPLMERNRIAAIQNNIWGTQNVATIAKQSGARKFIFISTDKAVYPANVMGATKRVSEMIIQQLSENSATQFAVVRFGNVLESRGSVIPIFKKQLARGGPLTVSHPDMVRYFMSIPEAVHLVLQAGSLSKGGELFILDMGEPIQIVELARALIREAGLEPDKDIAIQFIGIRPGEKVKESLTYDEERIAPSANPHISVIQPMPLNTDILSRNLKQLAKLTPQDADRAMQLLLRIIANNADDLSDGNESAE